jgi:hypothetical protein
VKLLTLNVEDKNFISFAKSMTDSKGDEVLFVDWVKLPTPKYQSRGNSPVKQIDIIKSTPKNVRLVIFDRYSCLTKDEVEGYLKRDTILLEPVLRPRPGFLFMPYWIDRIDLPLSTWDKERPFHTGDKSDISRVESDTILMKYAKAIEGIKIGISTDKISEERHNILKEIATFGDFPWDQFYTTLITGTFNDYHYGALPDIRNHLRYGTIPLVSHNHKWFHALFKNFIAFDVSTMIWYHKMSKIGNYGFMDELYRNIGNYMPEMFTENFVQTIISLCKK